MKRFLTQDEIDNEVIPKILTHMPELKNRQEKINKLRGILREQQIPIDLSQNLITILREDMDATQKLNSIKDIINIKQPHLPPQIVTEIWSILNLKLNQSQRLESVFEFIENNKDFVKSDIAEIQESVLIQPFDYIYLIPKFLSKFSEYSDNDDAKYLVRIREIYNSNKDEVENLINALQLYLSGFDNIQISESEILTESQLLMQGQGNIADDFRIQELSKNPLIIENIYLETILKNIEPSDELKLYYMGRYLESHPDIDIPEWLILLLEGKDKKFRELNASFNNLLETIGKNQNEEGDTNYNLYIPFLKELVTTGQNHIVQTLEKYNYKLPGSGNKRKTEVAKIKNLVTNLRQNLDITAEQFQSFLESQQTLSGGFNGDALLEILAIIKSENLTADFKNRALRAQLKKVEITNDIDTFVAEYVANKPRPLTDTEILDILQVLPQPIGDTDPVNGNGVADVTRFEIAQTLEGILKNVKITPKSIPVLKNRIIQRFNNALQIPGQPVGMQAASAMGSTVTQMTLNSVDWNEIVYIKIGQNNPKIILSPIGEFIDNLLENISPRLILHYDNETEYLDVNAQHLEVTCVDENGKMHWKKLEAITRHLPGGKMIKIKTSTGREVTVTKSKSLLVRNNNKIIPKLGADIKIGDYVPIVFQAPKIENPMLNYNIKYGNNLELNKNIKLDSDLGFICGYYLAEGYMVQEDENKQQDNTIVPYNISVIIYCKTNKIPYQKIKNNIYIKSEWLNKILKMYGLSDYSHKIPNWVLLSNLDFIEGLLDGYFIANKKIDIENNTIAISNKCKQTILYIAELLTYFQIPSNIIEVPGKFYILEIQLNQNIIANSTGYYIWKQAKINDLKNDIIPGVNTTSLQGDFKRDYLINYIANINNNGNNNKSDVEILKQAINSDVYFDTIVSVLEVESSHPKVYDFTVADTRNFTIFGGLCVRDTFHKAGSALNVTSGIERTNELIHVNKNPKSAKTTIFYEPKISFSEARDLMLLPPQSRAENSSDLIGYSFEEIIKKRIEIVNISVTNLLLGDPIIDSRQDLFSNYENDEVVLKFPWWYNIFNQIYGVSKLKASWVMRLRLNPLKLTKYNILVEDVVNAITTGFSRDRKSCKNIHCIDVIYSPDGSGIRNNADNNGNSEYDILPEGIQIPVIDIFPTDKLQQVIQGISYPNKENQFNFLNKIIKPSLKELHIKGIPNIREAYPEKNSILNFVQYSNKISGRFWQMHLLPVKSKLYGVYNIHVARLCWAAGLIVNDISEDGLELTVEIPESVFTTNTKIEPKSYIQNKISEDHDLEIDIQEENIKENIIPSRRLPASEIANASYFYFIQTVGSNLRQILTLSDVDTYTTHSNFPLEEYHIFGIEAARTRLLDELVAVFSQDGDLTINSRHVLLLTDFMCVQGDLVPLTYSGMSRQDAGFFSRASYERAMEIIYKAALSGEKESTSSVSAAIAVGNKPAMGTGNIELAFDYNKYKDLNQVDDLIGDEQDLENIVSDFTVTQTTYIDESSIATDGNDVFNDVDDDAEFQDFGDFNKDIPIDFYGEDIDESEAINYRDLDFEYESFDGLETNIGFQTALGNNINAETMRLLNNENTIPVTVQEYNNVNINGQVFPISEIMPPNDEIVTATTKEEEQE